MQKYACRIEYQGQGYSGWQSQTHSKSIQAELEQALSTVANAPVSTICAGRTDSGVHATGQIIHFETAVERSLYSWRMGTNANLPKDIAINWINRVDASFHARFSATERRYRYVIHNAASRSAIHYKKVTTYFQPLDAEAMHIASQHLLGEHDFTSFRAAHCQAKTAIRHLTNISIHRQQAFIYIDISANAFLHHMVRNIVGSLLPIGLGEQKPEWLADILQCKDRKQAGVTAPADGLYLVSVQYPPEFKLPEDDYLPQFHSANG